MNIKSIADKIDERLEYGMEDFTLKNGKKLEIHKCGVMYILKYPGFFKAYARVESLVLDLLELNRN